MSSSLDILVVAAIALVAFLLGILLPAFGRRVRAHSRLVAAASPLNPLMKRLMVEAPGTFMHSLVAANLSEAAAEAVGADALVARVGAYYHDIGKLKHPCYFFENLSDEGNPHDGAAPAASAGVITAHVTDGLELARRYHLPRVVSDIIGEHHGDSLVRYFYHQATRGGVAAYEADFRYHGKHPATRESAIVMLADASEASVRAMKDPVPAQIESSVRAVFDDRRADGQLDDCGLSNEDAERIVEVFVRYLVGFKHLRCEYPEDRSKGNPHADQRAEPSRV